MAHPDRPALVNEVGYFHVGMAAFCAWGYNESPALHSCKVKLVVLRGEWLLSAKDQVIAKDAVL